MIKRDLENRADVAVVVHNFYDKVREDEILGPIFNTVITDWEEHLDKLVTFWDMNLFGGKAYTGNPIEAHQHVDRVAGPIEPYHFGIWLNLWFETINALYEGDNADVLIRRARKMQTVIMVSIFQGRS